MKLVILFLASISAAVSQALPFPGISRLEGVVGGSASGLPAQFNHVSGPASIVPSGAWRIETHGYGRPPRTAKDDRTSHTHALTIFTISAMLFAKKKDATAK